MRCQGTPSTLQLSRGRCRDVEAWDMYTQFGGASRSQRICLPVVDWTVSWCPVGERDGGLSGCCHVPPGASSASPGRRLLPRSRLPLHHLSPLSARAPSFSPPPRRAPPLSQDWEEPVACLQVLRVHVGGGAPFPELTLNSQVPGRQSCFSLHPTHLPRLPLTRPRVFGFLSPLIIASV